MPDEITEVFQLLVGVGGEEEGQGGDAGVTSSPGQQERIHASVEIVCSKILHVREVERGRGEKRYKRRTMIPNDGE